MKRARVKTSLLVVISIVALFTLITDGATAPQGVAFERIAWPEGTVVLRFEDLEGAVLVRARLSGAPGRDTSGVLILDTGAGFLGVDRSLGRWLGIVGPASPTRKRGGSDPASPAPERPDPRSRPPQPTIDIADRPLRRLALDAWQVDQVSPVLTVEGAVMSRVTGRDVLGLLGQALFQDRILVLDYAARMLAAVPVTDLARRDGGRGIARLALSGTAVAIPFRLLGDGKAVLDAWVGSPSSPARIRLVLDTGATKTVLFRRSLERAFPGWRRWPRLRGLGAPTLTGDASAEIARVPFLRVGPQAGGVVTRGMDSAVLGGDLQAALSEDVGEPLDGLLGYSFLKHHRVAIDYPGRTLWVDPETGDLPDRPYEYSHPGLQLEASTAGLRVYSIVLASPAARAGLRRGDRVVAIDGQRVASADLARAIQSLEGPPGSRVRLKLRRGAKEWSIELARERLL